MDSMVQYNIRLPKLLRDRIMLIPHGRRTQFVRNAIEAALNYQDQSISRLQREINDMEAQIQIKKQLIKNMIAEENQRSKKEYEARECYEKFHSYVSNFARGVEFPGIGQYNTKRVNAIFGTNLKNFEHFWKICEDARAGNFSIDDFKSLRGDFIERS